MTKKLCILCKTPLAADWPFAHCGSEECKPSGATPVPSKDMSITLLREWHLADERFDLEDWSRRVRNLIEDAPQFFRNNDGDIDFGPVATHEPPADRCEVCTKPLPPVGTWSMPSCPDCQELLECLGQLMGDFADREQTIKAGWIERAINLICARPAPPPRSEWQPIETASHEHGSTCIVAVPNYNNKTIKNPPMLVGEAHYIYDEDAIRGQGWFWAGEDPTDAHGPGNIYPTHWMPLPEAPCSTSTKESEHG